MECSLRVTDESLPQVKEFQYFGFLNVDKLEREMDRQIGVSSAIMRALHCSFVVKRELSRKTKLSIDWCIFFPAPICGDEICDRLLVTKCLGILTNLVLLCYV